MDLDTVLLDKIIANALEEDIGKGDITTNAVLNENSSARAKLTLKQEAVICGLDIAGRVFNKVDANLSYVPVAQEGTPMPVKTLLATIEGPVKSLMKAERVALNFLQHMSGIATLTAEYASHIVHTRAKLLDTRKTTPGLRALEKYATQCGGAKNHRMGLYDAILIKDNHIAIAGGVFKAVQKAKGAGHKNIEVECETLKQVGEALEAGATTIMLDNMDVPLLCQAVEMNQGKTKLEASGGVTLKTIKDIAETGVDFISVGRITQSAPAVDISMDIDVSLSLEF